METHLCATLFHAAHDGHDTCVRELLGTGANPNIGDTYGWVPLHWASNRGHDACVRTLLAAGADPNAVNTYGWTPLHWAFCHGREACVRLLIESGANPNVDNDGITPLQLAVEKGYRECMKILIVRILADRALTDDEWDLIPPGSDLGSLLPTVMVRDGRDAAAKLVYRLPEEKRKVLETATMCLSRFVSRDVAEQILVRCVSY